jgi:hypothetical protein
VQRGDRGGPPPCYDAKLPIPSLVSAPIYFDRRTVVHSIAGCFFYGAFAAKVIVVRSRRLPGWALPVAGGTMVTLVVVLWYSAALWDFDNFDSPGAESERERC